MHEFDHSINSSTHLSIHPLIVSVCSPWQSYLDSGNDIIRGDGLSLVFPGKVIGTGGDINNENTTGPCECGTSILPHIGTTGQGILQDPTNTSQGWFEFHGRGHRCRRLLHLVVACHGSFCIFVRGIVYNSDSRYFVTPLFW